MQRITTFLTYNNEAQAAAKLYTSIFKNSKIVNESPMAATFEIEGQRFIALNGGPSFKFSEGISLFIDCRTQEEIDAYWEKLSEGGEQGKCGWLKDRFGVSWQVVPSDLGKMIGDRDPARSQRTVAAMLKMSKLDIKTLRDAYEGR
jgi:predicted 3-demethylubiquinone-9 3-methyltransferase (glyoxalase superfamily)